MHEGVKEIGKISEHLEPLSMRLAAALGRIESLKVAVETEMTEVSKSEVEAIEEIALQHLHQLQLLHNTSQILTETAASLAGKASDLG